MSTEPRPLLTYPCSLFILLHKFHCIPARFNNFQFSSIVQSCPTLCDPMNRSTPGLPVHHQSWSSLKLTCIESVMPSSHLILCRPLFLLPPIPPSIRVFSSESTLRRRWPKYWSFSFSIIGRQWHPTPVLLTGKSHGRRSLVGCSPWGR